MCSIMAHLLKLSFTIFLCSFSTLSFEIILMRIFSISLWYHFAFLIVSIAMLGTGASGTLLSLYPRLKNSSHISTYCLLLGTSIIGSYLISNQLPFDPVQLSWSKAQLTYFGLFITTLAFPFFFTGLILASALSCYSEKSGLLYGADMIGAGLGPISALFLMGVFTPEKIIPLLSVSAASASLIGGKIKYNIMAALLMLFNVILFVYEPLMLRLNISPYKGLQAALRYPGARILETYISPYTRIDTFLSPAIRFAPGLSLRYMEPLPEQVGIAVDGGDLYAITDSRQQERLKFLRYLPSSLPYEIISPENVLVINAKGGLQALVAEYYHSRNVFKTDSNPLLMKIMKGHHFSEKIYSRNTQSGFGRTWLSSSGKEFDIIDISLMGTSPAAGFGITEDYRFTVEAFEEYIKHLSPHGMLSMHLYIIPPPRDELRILLTAIMAMDRLGTKNISSHIAALRSWGTVCIIVKKSAFLPEDIVRIKTFSETRGFDLIYYPGIHPSETNIYVQMPNDEYHTAFTHIIHEGSRESFMENYIFNINPVMDENPFFHYYLRLDHIREIYQAMGEKWQYFLEEGNILPFIFLQVFLLSIIIVLLPSVSVLQQKLRHNGTSLSRKKEGVQGIRFMPYFAFIGIGFMFIEISLIQKMILVFEHPAYAFSIVLASILLSSGLGSLLSYRYPFFRKSYTLLLVVLLVFVVSSLFPLIVHIMKDYSMTGKAIMACMFFMPLGLFLGIPFPLGIRSLGQGHTALIPWAWAVNGCFSVLSPVTAFLIAISYGFKTVLFLGILCYVIAFIFMKKFFNPLDV